MEEIIDYATFEIENSGYAEKLSAGIVLTGGGSLLNHLSQLVKFKTGYDVRIGYPNEHLTADVNEDINSPAFSTSIGLILKGFEQLETYKRLSNDTQKENQTGGKKKVESKDVRRSTIIDKFKNKITEFFEENDTAM
jgi:cell division protein FtsA